MKISELIPSFQQSLLFEKNLTVSYVKDLVNIALLLEYKSEISNIKYYTAEKISAFLYQMRIERMWSVKTLRNYRQSLKTFFDFAKRKGYVKTNPVESIEKPKLPKTLPRCLSQKQVRRLISETHIYPFRTQIEHQRNIAIIFTFLYTGIRLSELLNLKVNQVNFDELYIFISKGKGAKDRYVPLHPRLLPILQSYLRLKVKKSIPSVFFFSSYRSKKPLTKKNIYAIFKKLSIASDVYITPHMLRHTMAKLSLEANLNPYKLKEILGHSNIATTQIYMSVSTENIKKSFNVLELL